MKITHKLPRLNISRDDCSASDFILTNGIGGFIALHKFPNSKHNGLFVAEGLNIFKVLEYISPMDSPEVEEIENSLNSVKRKRGDLTETFIMPCCNGLIYRLNRKNRIAIDLDCRRVDDFRNTGLYYQVTANHNHVTVHFSKKTDNQDDESHGKDEYELFIVFKPKSCDLSKDYQFLNEWNEFFYSLDAARHDEPKRWIFRPFIIDAKELLIGVGRTKEDAMKQVEALSKPRSAEENTKIMLVKKEKTVSAAFLCAQDSLEKLRIRHDGIKRTFAGLPWFYQFWTRDESISLGALIKTGRQEDAKKVVLRYLKGIGKDGRIPNRVPSSELGSADGVGWVFKRLSDLIEDAEDLGAIDKLFSKPEMANIKKMLKMSIDRIESNFMMSGLIRNEALETWMDTELLGDSRAGFRIEIQALHLNMLRLAHKLTGDKKYHEREKDMRREVHDNFWDRKVLADGLNDTTIRPNIFLAHYVYPGLMSRKEWEAAFDACLKALWLDWGDGKGALSSIDKSSDLMQWNYTGLNNMSYHRGDSWYWINNLAAICLLRNNAIKFESHIQKLISASAEEILWSGAAGHHAEVSSASHLSSQGCLAQAWSDAMFIELVMEAYQ
ncbi:hypothetical protein KY362_07480 [Candidatus Woesearchaeota archaeon]|nr:hypothetical protein [Candidatus Woesearchaeota archaeon]